jgi:hypothetical protein
MRVRRALAAGLLALVGGATLLALATPALAEGPVFGNLTVDPTSGPPDTQITATFELNPAAGGGCGGFKVIFRWDTHQVGGAQNLDHCAASVSFKPPKDFRKPGRHFVTVTDESKPSRFLAVPASFLIIAVDPSPSRSSASPSPSAGKSKGPKASASPDTTDPAIVDAPVPTDAGPTVDVSVTPLGGAAGSDSGDGGSSALGIALAFGGALMLGGVVILGYIVVKGRRGEPEYALAESTQQVPTFPGGFTPEGGAPTAIEMPIVGRPPDPPPYSLPPYSPHPPPVPE